MDVAELQKQGWELKYRIKLPVAEIGGQFEGCDDHWYVNIVSADGDVLLLVSFGRWVLHVDSDGKLIDYSYMIMKPSACSNVCSSKVLFSTPFFRH